MKINHVKDLLNEFNDDYYEKISYVGIEPQQEPFSKLKETYKNYKNFMIKKFMSNKKKTKIKLAIDTKNDLKIILKKFKKKNFINFSLK